MIVVDLAGFLFCFPHLAAAAFLDIASRCAGVKAKARALPPALPISRAASDLESSGDGDVMAFMKSLLHFYLTVCNSLLYA